MHILHVYKDYFPVLGGIENHIRVLAEAQVRAGHVVTVLVTNPERGSTETMLNGVRVIKASRLATVASTPLSLSLPRILRELRADITHLHLPYPVAEVAQLAAGPGRPYVVTYHADVTRRSQRAIMRVYAPVVRRLLRGAARVIATSPNYVASSPYLRAVADRVTIVPLGVDETRFTPAPGPRPPRPPTLLFVGQLRHYKGLDDLLRALTRLPAETMLVIVGSGPLRARLEPLARQLGVAERVRFLGRVSDEDLPDVYRAADVFVLPATTRAEAFGTVLLEAMASGLPCVAADVPGSGMGFVVQPGVTGLLVPPRSPAALAEALAGLLADAGLRARLGAAGRDRVLAHFTEARMAAGVEAVYADIVKSAVNR